jgi:hypothetical protein
MGRESGYGILGAQSPAHHASESYGQTAMSPHSIMQQGAQWISTTDQLERSKYERGEKWWGPDNCANPNLTPQKPLLDGAEGKLVDNTDNDNTGTKLSDTLDEQRGMIGDVFPPGLTGEGTTATTRHPGITEGETAEMHGTILPGLEPPRLMATGGPVTGADMPQHRIDNKRRRKELLVTQSPKTQWTIYRGEFDLPPPKEPLATH